MAQTPPSDVVVHGLSGTLTNVFCWLFTALAALTLAARLVSRIHLTKHYGIDDTLIVVAFAFLLGMTIVNSVAVAHGAGSHFNTLSPQQQKDSTKWVFVIQCMSSWTLAMPKLSVVALLVRVFEPKRWVSILFYAMAILGVIIAAITTATWVAQCKPPERIWDPQLPGSCWPREVAFKVAEFQFAQSVVYDFIFAIYPVLILMKLQMSMHRKLGICANMALGIFAGIVGIIKLARFPIVAKMNLIDPPYVQTQVSVEVEIEAALLIIAACIPTSGPVLVRLKNVVLTSVSRSSGRSYNEPNDPSSRSERPRRRRENDLEFGEEIPMTAHAAQPSTKDLSRVHSQEKHAGTFFDSSTGTRSLSKSAGSSDELPP